MPGNKVDPNKSRRRGKRQLGESRAVLSSVAQPRSAIRRKRTLSNSRQKELEAYKRQLKRCQAEISKLEAAYAGQSNELNNLEVEYSAYLRSEYGRGVSRHAWLLKQLSMVERVDLHSAWGDLSHCVRKHKMDCFQRGKAIRAIESNMREINRLLTELFGLEIKLLESLAEFGINMHREKPLAKKVEVEEVSASSGSEISLLGSDRASPASLLEAAGVGAGASGPQQVENKTVEVNSLLGLSIFTRPKLLGSSRSSLTQPTELKESGLENKATTRPAPF
jgi:hypothetical protein